MILDLKGSRYDPMARDEEHEMFLKYRENPTQELKNILIERNLRYAMMVSRQYTRGDAVFDELLSEAVLGLEKAVDKFDVGQGVRFISYAVFWIKQGIRNHLTKDKTIYVPLYKDHGISEETLSDEEKEKVERRKEQHQMATICAFDDQADDEGFSFQDVLPQTTFDEPEDEFKKQEAIALLDKMLIRLDDREKYILKMYYGNQLTYDNMADKYGITRERVRQLCVRAMKKVQQYNPNFIGNHRELL